MRWSTRWLVEGNEGNGAFIDSSVCQPKESVMTWYSQITSQDIAQNPDLRKFQKELFESCVQRLQRVLQTPDSNIDDRTFLCEVTTGAGKSGCTTLLPFGLADGRVLVSALLLIRSKKKKQTLIDAHQVLTPTIPTLESMRGTWDGPSSFLARTRVLRSHHPPPKVCVFSSELSSRVQMANVSAMVQDTYCVVLATVAQLKNIQTCFPQPDAFSLIVYDEGHHQPALTWDAYRCHFHRARAYILLTATPQRSDGKKLAGSLAYRYSLRDAALRDFIVRRPVFVEVCLRPRLKNVRMLSSPAEMPKEAALLLLEATWRLLDRKRRKTNCLHKAIGVAGRALIRTDGTVVADDQRPNETIKAVNRLVRWCQEWASSVRVWDPVVGEERPFRVWYVHSTMAAADRPPWLSARRDQSVRDGVMEAFEKSPCEIDLLFHIGMLSEGYDHPSVSIVTFFTPVRSLGPFMQQVGRAQRMNTSWGSSSMNKIAHALSLDLFSTRKLWNLWKQQESDGMMETEVETMSRRSTWSDASEDAHPSKPPIVADGDPWSLEGVLLSDLNHWIDSMFDLEEDVAESEYFPRTASSIGLHADAAVLLQDSPSNPPFLSNHYCFRREYSERTAAIRLRVLLDTPTPHWNVRFLQELCRRDPRLKQPSVAFLQSTRLLFKRWDHVPKPACWINRTRGTFQVLDRAVLARALNYWCPKSSSNPLKNLQRDLHEMAQLLRANR